LINNTIDLLTKYIKLHIRNQVKNGASIIQIFDSWAGLLEEKDLEKYLYIPTKEIVSYTKKLKIPVICFPRNINNYKKFVDIIKPDVINIDYNVKPEQIINEVNIPIQGGIHPKMLLTDKETLKKEVLKFKQLFKNHPYIFNLGHGVLPETNPKMVEYLIKFVKEN